MAFNRIRSARVAIFIASVFACSSASIAWSRSAQTAPAKPRQPLLVELFTSEGCSDCRPADALLARLDSIQFVPGAQAIVLSEHVTYWNRLGWRDPFSLDEMTQRQEHYVAKFGLESSYTPQLVVDGTTQVVGNNPAAVTAAVTQAVGNPKLEISIANARWTGGAVQFSVHGATRTGTSLVGAVAEDATHSEVARGENAGRTLHHVAVVRVLKDFGSDSTDDKVLKLSADSLSHPEPAAGPIRLVVFLVDRKTGHVTAVAEQSLSR